MKRHSRWTQRLADGLLMENETLPLQSVLELCADRRVLIENHGGVTQYSSDRICVRVKFGQVEICGKQLRLCHMRGPQLVIFGKIDSIHVCRGKV